MSVPDPELLSDSELLRHYLQGHDGRAFEALVVRHLPLVYGVAHRHSGGQTLDAEDVAQEVFLRLARQAPALASHPSLSGWCFRTARHVALDHYRAVSRRRQREAVACHPAGTPDPDPDPDWDNVRPLLDESLESLPDRDRDVILWRYFEKRPHGEIASRLGIQENAARMRVERALDRLRALLERRGITSTAAAIALALGAHATELPPAGLAGRIASQVFAPAVAAGGVATLLAWITRPVHLALAVGIVGGLVLWTTSLRNPDAPGAAAGSRRDVTPAPVAVESRPAADGLAPTAAGSPALRESTTNGPFLQLAIKDSRGVPVSGVALRILRSGENSLNEETVTNGNAGLSVIRYTPDQTRLQILTRIEGFADTRLYWDTSVGDAIPEYYALTLEPGVRLGGRVVDPEGQPLGGVEIQLQHMGEAGVDRQGPRSLLPRVTLRTGSDGSWETRRVSESGLAALQFACSREGYGGFGRSLPLHSAEETAQLREGRWVTVMTPADSVHGVVVDAEGFPVPEVLVSTISDPTDCSNCPSTRTEADGTFVLSGVIPGSRFVYALSDAYPAVSAEIPNPPKADGLRIVIRPGRTIRLRVTNREGEGIEGAMVYFMAAEIHGPLRKGLQKTDAEGRIVWTNAPLFELAAHVDAREYRHEPVVPIQGGEEEQVLSLSRFQFLRGTVTERGTGRLIPQFQLVTGLHPEFGPQGPSRVFWDAGEPGRFNDGRFRFNLQNSVFSAEPHSIVVRCSAPGFAPSICPPFPRAEGETEFHFVLDRIEPLDRWIVDAAGNPVAQATVAPLTQRSQVTLSNGFLQSAQTDDVLLKTDESGRVTIPFWPEVQRVVMASPAGFALFSSEDIQRQRTLTLEPWGRIEGHLGDMGYQTPVSFIGLGDGETFGLAPVLGSADSETVPDSSGNFVFNTVPGGTHALFLGFRSRDSWYSRYIREVTVRPGETRRVELASPRRTVIARVLWGRDVPEAWRARARAVLRGGRHNVPLEIPLGSSAWLEWIQQSSPRPLARHYLQFPGTIEPDGTVRFERVDRGNYQVQILVEQASRDPQNPPVYLAQGRIEVTVPEEPSEEPLEAGEVRVEPVANP